MRPTLSKNCAKFFSSNPASSDLITFYSSTTWIRSVVSLYSRIVGIAFPWLRSVDYLPDF